MNPNLQAYLDTIQWSEGTDVEGSDNGYNVLVTGTPPPDADVIDLGNGRHLFKSYADHPGIVMIVNPHLLSTAAGRYQQMHHDWPIYKQRLALPDFGPASQDALAVQHIRECRALDIVSADAVKAKDFTTAISLCSKIWASFPGNAYGQRTRHIDDLLDAFARVGGVLA